MKMKFQETNPNSSKFNSNPIQIQAHIKHIFKFKSKHISSTYSSTYQAHIKHIFKHIFKHISLPNSKHIPKTIHVFKQPFSNHSKRKITHSNSVVDKKMC